MPPASHALRVLALALVPACISPPGILGVADDGSDGAGTGDDDPGSTGAASMTGNANDGGGDGGSTGGEPSSCVGPDAFGAEVVAQSSLTTAQWDGAVADLLGVDARTARDAGVAATVWGFDMGITTSPEAVALVTIWAEQAAEAADLAALMPCDPASVAGDDALACFTAFVHPLAEAAWRRPPTDDERAAMNAQLGTTADFAGDVRMAIAGVLQAAAFWHVTPTGTPGDDPAVLVLDGPSLALRMSLRLWNGLPDAELRQAGADGSLLQPEVRAAQIARMLADPRAARMIRDFHEQWLRIRDVDRASKDDDLFPTFDAGLGVAMREESTRFAADVVLAGDGRLETLLTAPYTFANAEVAALYGDSIVEQPMGAAFERVDLDPDQRGGLLTQPAWLTVHSHHEFVGFARRGDWITRELLCGLVPPPPPGVDTNQAPPPPEEGLSNKDWRDSVVGDPACLTCHAIIDPPSFAFDNYDAIGRWTDEVFGAPVDPSGMIEGLSFADRDQLVAGVLASDAVAECVPLSWARYALGRDLADADACLIERLRDTFTATDGDLREVITAIAASDAFAHVRPVP